VLWLLAHSFQALIINFGSQKQEIDEFLFRFCQSCDDVLGKKEDHGRPMKREIEIIFLVFSFANRGLGNHTNI